MFLIVLHITWYYCYFVVMTFKWNGDLLLLTIHKIYN